MFVKTPNVVETANWKDNKGWEQNIPVISSGVQAAFKQAPSVSLNATLGQVHFASTEETQPATDADSERHRSY